MELRDNERRARQAIGIFWAVAAGNLLMAAVDIGTIIVAPSYIAPSGETVDQLLIVGRAAMFLLQIVLLIVSTIFMIRWLRRAYWNLHALGRPLEHSEGWAAGAWFVPFLNWVRPYTITREVWQQTRLVAYGDVEPHGLLRWWWMLYLVDRAAGNISARMAPDENSTSAQVSQAASVDLLASLVGIAAAVVTVLVIRRMAANEEQLHLRQQLDQLGGPAPEPAAYLQQDQEESEQY